MRCASYTRTTICAYEEETPRDIIKQQNQRIQAYIKRHGWKLVEKYSDRKNDPDCREAFDEMRNDGIARKFDMIVIDSVFRCGNNFSAAKDLLLKVFYPVGIHFAVVEDDICSVDMSSEQVAMYLKNRQNVYQSHFSHAHMRRQYANGRLQFYDAKYGYVLNANQTGFLVDEEAAAVVKEVFRLRLADKTFRQIAEILNEQHIDTPTAHRYKNSKKEHYYRTKWESKSVEAILKQTAYIGHFTKKVAGKDYVLHYPIIIDESVFQEVQQKTAGRTPRVIKNKMGSLVFTGRLINGDTGIPMHSYKHKELEGSPRRYHINNGMTGPWIAYETIYTAMREAIIQECDAATQIKELMNTEAGAEIRALAKQHFSLQAREICAEMVRFVERDIQAFTQYESGKAGEDEYRALHEEYQGTLRELEQQYAGVMDNYNETMIAWSAKNPWIERFADKTVPQEIAVKESKLWVKMIRVYNLEKVTVELTEKEWRDKLPLEWRECFDGAEKQA